MKDIVKDIENLILKAQSLADKHGLFPNHRELLDCQYCRLMEDVTIEGKLVVYREGKEDIDLGLRFPEPDEMELVAVRGIVGV
ncbi:MAG: hypothetical protein NG784_08405 [Candidatus Jettenia sp.]|nr:hypothetical protein [Candidatus Jettenia sp.]